MEILSKQRHWQAGWPPSLTAAIEARVLECQRSMVALCMQEVRSSGLSPIVYFEKSYRDRQDGDFLSILESYFELDEQVIAELPPAHSQKLRDIISLAERDIENLLNVEQSEAFADEGIRPLLAGIVAEGSNEVFCELNELHGGERDEGSYKEYFCSKPFDYAEIAQRGTTFLCCPVMLPTAVGNADDGTFMDVWNSAKAQQIRASILDGSYSYCLEKTCGMLQEKLLPKREHVTDSYHRNIIDNNLTVLPKGPTEIVMNYDRSCNLACPSCRVDHVVIGGEQKLAAAKVQEWATADHLADARRLHITGSGDALGSRLFHNFLRSFDPESMPHLRISLGTNALLLTPHTWDRICHEAIDIVVASCDAATAGTYAINRGGDFDVLVENLHFIGSLRKAGKLQHFVMNYVVQKNNYAEMKDFVALGQRVNADVVMFQQLTNWGTFEESEFRTRAVHRPSHPEHTQLLSVLQDPIFNLPIVNMFNLIGLKDTVARARPQDELESSVEAIQHSQAQHDSDLRSEDDVRAELSLKQAVEVVQSYGKLLEFEKDKIGSEVLDANDLPHSKTSIKQSLLLVVKSSADKTEKTMLLSAYILLANFQDTSIKPEGGHTNAAGTKAVDLERQVLADELKQAGYEL